MSLSLFQGCCGGSCSATETGCCRQVENTAANAGNGQEHHEHEGNVRIRDK